MNTITIQHEGKTVDLGQDRTERITEYAQAQNVAPIELVTRLILRHIGESVEDEA